MVVSSQEVEEIQIVTKDGELIASITDKSTIEKEGYEVVCIPEQNEARRTEYKEAVTNKRLLREQLELLAEKSKSENCTADELAKLSEQMGNLYFILGDIREEIRAGDEKWGRFEYPI